MLFSGVKKWCKANVFSDTKQKHIWWRILKAERFFLCCGSILFSMLRFVKCVRFSQRNCIVKWVIFFASCCWFWNFLLEKNMMSTGTCGRIWKKLYDQNNTFKTRIPNMRFWIIYILVQILFWGGTVLGRFSQFFFLIFVFSQPYWLALFPRPPVPPLPHTHTHTHTIKKLPGPWGISSHQFCISYTRVY